MQQRSRNRLVLIAIAVLFFLPVLAAVLMQSKWWHFEPAHTTNRGALVEPPQSIPDGAVDWTTEQGPRWMVLYLPATDCGKPCVEDAAALRQIHIGLGRRREHVVIGLLPANPGGALAPDEWQRVYDEFVIGAGRGDDAWQVLRDAAAATGVGDATMARHAFLLDPAGRVVLAYPADFTPGDINKDLKRLLKGGAE